MKIYIYNYVLGTSIGWCISTGNNFALLGIFGNVWGYFCLLHLRGVSTDNCWVEVRYATKPTIYRAALTLKDYLEAHVPCPKVEISWCKVNRCYA